MTISRQQEAPSKLLGWIRDNDNLDAHKGYRLYDIDGIFFNVASNKYIVLETKCENKMPAPHQILCLSVLDDSLKLNKKINYQGCYCISMGHDLPNNGSVNIFKMIDGKFERELKIELSKDSDEKFLAWIESKLLGEEEIKKAGLRKVLDGDINKILDL